MILFTFVPLTMAFIIAIYTAVSGKKEYEQFVSNNALHRLKLYKHWVAESWLLFGLFGILALIVSGHTGYIIGPIQTMSIINVNEDTWNSDGSSILLGIVIGVALALVILYIRSRRAIRHAATNPVDMLVPQTKTEKRWALYMAVTAGITEELFFRAAVPALMYVLTGNAVISLASGVVLFAFQHIYQGWRGILGTLVLGWVFTKVFLATGTILAPIALHALIDINGLLLLPWLARKWSAHK